MPPPESLGASCTNRSCLSCLQSQLEDVDLRPSTERHVANRKVQSARPSMESSLWGVSVSFSPVLVWDGPTVLSLPSACLSLPDLITITSSTCPIVSSPLPQVFKPTSPSGPGCLVMAALFSVSVSSPCARWTRFASDLGLQLSTPSDQNKRPEIGLVPALDRWKLFAV